MSHGQRADAAPKAAESASTTYDTTDRNLMLALLTDEDVISSFTSFVQDRNVNLPIYQPQQRSS